MSKKHFIAIAAALKAMRPGADPAALATLDQVAQTMATTFAGFNDLFDCQRFLDACGCASTPVRNRLPRR